VKLVLKLLLTVFVLLASVYASSPLWISSVLARHMPDGWRLETLKSGYPGFSGIRLKSIRVSGDTGPAALTLGATDVYLEYRTLETRIDSVAVDVFMQTGDEHSAEPVSPDDLTLPVLELTADMPRLSVNRVDVAVHMSGDGRTVGSSVDRPLRLDLEELELTPGADGAYRLAGQLGFEDSLRFTGALAADVNADGVDASIRFPSRDDTPWLYASFVQKTRQAGTTTRVETVLDADAANRDWLDSVLARGTRRTVTQVGGKLSLDAAFAGHGQQHIEHLELVGDELLLLSEETTLKINADLALSRDGETIAIGLAKPATLEYRGDGEWFEQLLAGVVPGLRVPRAPEAVISAAIAQGASAAVTTGNPLSARFTGNVDVDLLTGPEHLVLKSSALQVEMADINQPGSATVEGAARIDWTVDAPVDYAADDLHLSAGGLAIGAEVISHDGTLTSNGAGSFMRASATAPLVSADKMDLAWESLDLETLTGKLTVKTQGFSIRLDDQTWKDFDLDMAFTLMKKNDVSGAGKVAFASGTIIPLELTGNTQSMRWDIRLAPATVRLAKLRSLLSVAGIKLPAAIKMTDGFIDVQGDVRVGDDITAKLLIGGHDMVASMHNSKLLGAGFSIKAGYDKKPSASGSLSIGTLELAGDIDLENIKAVVDVEDVDRFRLNDLYAEVFDGRVELDSLAYSADGIADTVVRFSHIDLGKLLAYVDIDGLQGSGILDMTLPVGSDNTGIHVKHGTFTSNGGGRLAYTREGLAGSNIGLKALENFLYKSLSGTIDYQSDGAYVMTVRLEGSNPDLYEGHPVVFNLNINGTLPALFEALFMTGSFEESILNEIKSRQR